MTKIKLCGLTRVCDIETANELRPDYIGFVFAPTSRRYITPETAAKLKRLLHPQIKAVGVFVNQRPEVIADLLDRGIIDLAQLHGSENRDDILALRALTRKPILQAFRIQTAQDAAQAQKSAADYILLDSGGGTGTAFDWTLINAIHRPYFLAGGLEPSNVKAAIQVLHPFAVDVSSGIETDGQKDKNKMAAFVHAVRQTGKKVLT